MLVFLNIPKMIPMLQYLPRSWNSPNNGLNLVHDLGEAGGQNFVLVIGIALVVPGALIKADEY